MFLKLQGVTGEAKDADHKGEIDVVSWSWGMEQSKSRIGGNVDRATMTELHVVKRVDQSSPTLMSFLFYGKRIGDATLTVRKAGKKPLEYFTIELGQVLVTSMKTESENAELFDHVKLGFSSVTVSYIPQDELGGKGGGTNTFEADVDKGF